MNNPYSQNQTSSIPSPPQTRWFENSVIIILLILCCFPTGLILLWVKKDWSTQTKLIITGVWACLMVIGSLLPKPAPTSNANQITSASTAPSSQSVSQATPVAISTPTFTELKQRSDSLLQLNKEEYTDADLKEFDAVVQPLREISKDSKEYSAAQALNNKLIEKSSRVGAELLVLGAKPKNSEWDGRVDPVVTYLKKTLNDYGSSEFVEWSPVTKVLVKKEPYWAVRLKLRAKNAFGALILKETYFLIRQNQVVLAQGL